MRRGTDRHAQTHTDGRDQIHFASATPHAKRNYKPLLLPDSLYKHVVVNRHLHLYFPRYVQLKGQLFKEGR